MQEGFNKPMTPLLVVVQLAADKRFKVSDLRMFLIPFVEPFLGWLVLAKSGPLPIFIITTLRLIFSSVIVETKYVYTTSLVSHATFQFLLLYSNL